MTLSKSLWLNLVLIGFQVCCLLAAGKSLINLQEKKLNFKPYVPEKRLLRSTETKLINSKINQSTLANSQLEYNADKCIILK